MTSTLRLELDVIDDPSVLVRIVGICHQRGLRIVSLQYDRTASAGLVLLAVDADNRLAARLEFWLSGLIHVLAVRTAFT